MVLMTDVLPAPSQKTSQPTMIKIGQGGEKMANGSDPEGAVHYRHQIRFADRPSMSSDQLNGDVGGGSAHTQVRTSHGQVVVLRKQKNYNRSRPLSWMEVDQRKNNNAAVFAQGSRANRPKSYVEGMKLQENFLKLKKEEPILCGEFWHQPAGFLTRWRERILILKHHSLACLKKTVSQAGDTIWSIPLTSIREIKCLERKGSCILVLEASGIGRNYFRKTDGLKDWCDIIQKQMNESKEIEGLMSSTEEFWANRIDKRSGYEEKDPLWLISRFVPHTKYRLGNHGKEMIRSDEPKMRRNDDKKCRPLSMDFSRDKSRVKSECHSCVDCYVNMDKKQGCGKLTDQLEFDVCRRNRGSRGSPAGSDSGIDLGHHDVTPQNGDSEIDFTTAALDVGQTCECSCGREGCHNSRPLVSNRDRSKEAASAKSSENGGQSNSKQTSQDWKDDQMQEGRVNFRLVKGRRGVVGGGGGAAVAGAGPGRRKNIPETLQKVTLL